MVLQMGGQALLPGAAMFEIALAGASMLSTTPRLIVLAQAAITAPCTLPPPGTLDAAQLTCHLSSRYAAAVCIS